MNDQTAHALHPAQHLRKMKVPFLFSEPAAPQLHRISSSTTSLLLFRGPQSSTTLSSLPEWMVRAQPPAYVCAHAALGLNLPKPQQKV